MPYSITLSIKKQTIQKKPKAVKDMGGGSRVDMTAVKDSMVFLKLQLAKKIKKNNAYWRH